MATIIDELREEGREEGRQQGRQEGIQEGEQRGVAAATLRLLRHRLGPLDAALEERIGALPVDVLHQLGEAVLDSADPIDLKAWLAQRATD